MEWKLKRERVRDDGEESVATEENNDSTKENDPASKRRTIRSHYREIENRINEGRDEMGDRNCAAFMAIMNEVENVHQHVKKPREQVADAEALLGLTSTLVASVKTHSSGDVTPAEFISCLIRDFGQSKTMKEHLASSHNISWQTIGSTVPPIFMNGAGCMTMIGSMNNELKQRKLYVRKKRTRSLGKARPKELEKAAEVVTDTDRNMQVMFEILKKQKRVKVENLMLNRDSFAQTVENLFALSFLAKDGRVNIDVDENGSQIVVPCNGPSSKEIKSGAVKHHQFIFRFNFTDWKLMKTLVPEGEELMPRRGAFSDAGVAKEPGDAEGFSTSENILSDSQLAHTASIKKFSRNYGRSMQNIGLTQTGDGIGTLNWNSKQKRSHIVD